MEIKKWWAYIVRGACPKCGHKLVERSRKRLNAHGKVVGSQPVEWCRHCGHEIFLMQFWFP